MAYPRAMSTRKAALCITFICMALTAPTCAPPEREHEYPPERGVLRLLLTDAPLEGEVEAIVITIARVDLVFADPLQPITSITPTRTTFDLLTLRNGVTEELGIAALPPGVLSQIRLIIDSAEITIDGHTSDLRIPSGSQTGIKLNGEVEIAPCVATTVLIDLDAEKSLHRAPGHGRGDASGYVLRPVISMRSVETGLDLEPPSLMVVEDGTITDAGKVSFQVEMEDPSGLDTGSFVALLNGVDVSDRFTIMAGLALSDELELGRPGVNRLVVSLEDTCGNRAQVEALIFRGDPGDLPEAFAELDEGGGVVAVTESGSSIAGAELVVPAAPWTGRR